MQLIKVRQNKKYLTNSTIWLLFVLLLVCVYRENTELSHGLYTILATASYFFCVYNWVKCGNRIVSLFSFFMLYSFLCNCIQSLLYVFGVPPELLTAYWFPSFASMCEMMRYQALCIAALNLGVVLYITKKGNSSSIDEQFKWYSNVNSSWENESAILTSLYFICLIGSFIALYNTANVRAAMSYHEYMDEGHNEVQTYFYFSYFFLFLGLRYIFSKRFVYLTYAAWIVLTLGYMLLGLRTQAIPYIACFVITVPITNPGLFKKHTIPFWVVGSVVFFIGLGLISSTREYSGTDLATGYQGFGTSLIYSVGDVGSVSQMTAITMDEIEKGMPHYQTILYFLTTVIPTRVLKLPVDLFNALGPAGWDISPGTFMSERMGRSGMGFSFLAESFMNYGWFGCIYILLYGYIIAFLENSAYKKIMKGSFFRITFLLLLTRLVFYARADLWLCNNYVEYMVFTGILYILFNQRKKKVSFTKQPFNTPSD